MKSQALALTIAAANSPPTFAHVMRGAVSALRPPIGVYSIEPESSRTTNVLPSKRGTLSNDISTALESVDNILGIQLAPAHSRLRVSTAVRNRNGSTKLLAIAR